MVDVANLVPSARDFLQAIATRRRRLGLVPLVDAPEDVPRLLDLGVRAFAVAQSGDLAKRVAGAIGSTPLIVLQPITTVEESLAARESGADAVVIDASMDVNAYEELSKAARSTRMAALAHARDHESAAKTGKTTAKAMLLSVYGVEPLASILQPLAGSMRVLAQVPAADETALRAMKGLVDAAIVESAIHLSTSFDTLREELDP